ncbi:MAG: glycosyltransferase family 2 protein [Acidobacteriota bacterium]
MPPVPRRASSSNRRGGVLLYLPAYNAARTLERTLSEIPSGLADELLLVDDGSGDDTAALALRWGLKVLRHSRNLGYGASQKSAYREALRRGFEVVVMLHPDTQHDGRLLPYLVGPVREGIYDVMLGSRIRTRAEALSGGMPLKKYLANRSLTLVQNLVMGQNLSEWHTGFRAYHRRVLQAVFFERNSDNFVFDTEMLLQAVMLGFRVGEIPIPVRYGLGASSIGAAAAARYALGTLGALGSCLLHRAGLRRDPRWCAVERRSDASSQT